MVLLSRARPQRTRVHCREHAGPHADAAAPLRRLADADDGQVGAPVRLAHQDPQVTPYAPLRQYRIERGGTR